MRELRFSGPTARGVASTPGVGAEIPTSMIIQVESVHVLRDACGEPLRRLMGLKPVPLSEGLRVGRREAVAGAMGTVTLAYITLVPKMRFMQGGGPTD